MENREEVARLSRAMSESWRRMVDARAKGDWPYYWAVRRVWLAQGRLMSSYYVDVASEATSQGELFDIRVGRPHDGDAA